MSILQNDLRDATVLDLFSGSGALGLEALSRGAAHEIQGPDEQAQALGMTKVIASGVRTEDEGLYPVQHGFWKDVMDKGLAAEERAALLKSPNTVRLALGPRILRADTAAVAALALVGAVLGDWR